MVILLHIYMYIICMCIENSKSFNIWDFSIFRFLILVKAGWRLEASLLRYIKEHHPEISIIYPGYMLCSPLLSQGQDSPPECTQVPPIIEKD